MKSAVYMCDRCGAEANGSIDRNGATCPPFGWSTAAKPPRHIKGGYLVDLADVCPECLRELADAWGYPPDDDAEGVA